MQLTKELLRQIVGALALCYAVYPFVYSRFNNVADTGNKAVDDAAEGFHDAGMTLVTFITTVYAILALLLGFLAIYLLPDSMFAEKVAAA